MGLRTARFAPQLSPKGVLLAIVCSAWIVAAVLGFGVVAGTAATIAKVLFVVFLILFVVSLIMGRGRPSDVV